MKETPKNYIFERFANDKLNKNLMNKIQVAKTNTGRWGYVRPLFEDSWVIFDNNFQFNYYEFNW